MPVCACLWPHNFKEIFHQWVKNWQVWGPPLFDLNIRWEKSFDNLLFVRKITLIYFKFVEIFLSMSNTAIEKHFKKQLLAWLG